jgi:flagellar hook-associated protein 3 FlgL
MTTIHSAQSRVTQRAIAAQTLSGLQANLGKLGELQNKLSSGREISRPSDSPTGTVSAMQFRSEIRTNEQWSRNAADGIGWLGTIDQTLTSALDSTRRARDLTLQGLNSGAGSAQSREALAAEIDQLRTGLIGLANTRYLDRPVFGGTTPGTQSYDAAGAYAGPATSLPVLRTVGASATVRVDQTGPEVFGPDGANLFDVLGKISADLRANDITALRADLGDLDTAMRRIQGKLSEVGANYNRVEQMRKAAEDRVISLRASLAGVEDIDLPRTIVDLQMQQVAYEAALGATQRIVTPSLADFLR